MKLSEKIIFIIILILVLVVLYINFFHRCEKYTNMHSINDGYQNITNLKKNKITKKIRIKNDYQELEIRNLTPNPIYDKLSIHLKKYSINHLYNLENLELNMPLVITYDNLSIKNEKNESFTNFIKGLNHYKYNFIVCGINNKWDGWYGRYKIYLELLNVIPDEQLLFITDSRDVLVNDSSNDFKKKYENLIDIYNDKQKNKIIFGTEIGCCVNQMWHYFPGDVFKNINEDLISNIKDKINKNVIDSNDKNIELINLLGKIEIEENNSEYNNHPTYNLYREENKIYTNGNEFPWEPWKNWNNFFKQKLIEALKKYKLPTINNEYPLIKLNFGMMVGINDKILKMLKLFDLRSGEDDQHLASEFFYKRPEMVILDYTQILLSNTGYKHAFRKCTSKTMNNTYYNVNFNDHLNDHDEYIDMNVYTREDIPEQGVMYGFDFQNLKYFFTYDDVISYPCFIQSPGKDWNCYNELLYRMPYCDEKMCSYYYNLEQTQKYNVRDIIIHEYKNQNSDLKIEWILLNLLNPLYWALNLYIVKDIFDIIYEKMKNYNTAILLNSNNLLGYYQFKNLKNQNIQPWNDNFNLAWFINKLKLTQLAQILEDFFKNIIQKGYEIFVYYKEIYTNYSLNEKDYFTIKLNSENILQISSLLSKYEIVLFNILIAEHKYFEILKLFNMDNDYEEKYIDGKIQIPSIDILIFEFNSLNKSFEYNKLFGIGHPISIPENIIIPIQNIKFNNLDLKIPNDLNKYLKLIYSNNKLNKNSNFEIIKIQKYFDNEEDKKKLSNFNKLEINIKDSSIILITKIYNNFINKYFEIINSKDTIKKIIST